MSEIEYTQFALPPSNVGSAEALRQLRDRFGRGKWDKPIQIAALLDALIAYTNDLLAEWKKGKPALPWLSDPAGTWESINSQLLKARQIYRYWRNEVGRVTQWDNPDAIAQTVTDPLLYGNWTYYEETGLPYPPGTNKFTLPVAGMPWSAGVQMNVVIQHNAQVFEKWVTEDLPASVEEGLKNVADVAGGTVDAVSTKVAQTTGGIFTALWRSTPAPVKLGGFLVLYLMLANAGLR